MAAIQNSRISLISKSDIRYEGTLFSINPEENTVALRNVKMLGTESRRDGSSAVSGSDQIYEYIVFRGSDIKDLTVFEQASNQNQLPPDPAILSGAAGRGNFSNQFGRNQGGNRSSGQGRSDSRRDQGGYRGGYHGDRDDRDYGRDRNRNDRDRNDRVRSYNDRDRDYNNRRGGDRNDNRRGGYDNRRGGDRNDNRRPRGSGGPGGAGGPGGFNRNRNSHLHTGQNFVPSANPSDEYKEEFDFATANQSLDKDKIAEEVTKTPTNEDTTKAARPVYSSKNFFDELSCEALDAKHGTSSRPPDRDARELQKKNDVDTFGDAAMNVAGYGYGGRRRGMGRGRGRGGRGGRRY